MNSLAVKKLSFVLFALLLPLQACAVSGGPVDGKVLEEGTNKPIAGAIVTVLWKHHQGYSGTVCYHVETATTNEKGEYHIPKWSNPSDTRTLKDPYVSVSAYKPGYGLPSKPSQKDQDALLAPFTGDRGERLTYIERVKQSTVSCADPKADGKNLIPLYRALYEEAKPLAQTRDEQSIATGFLSWIKILERDTSK